MPLFVLESRTRARDRDAVQPVADAVATALAPTGGELIEVQVATNLGRLYLVVEHADQGGLTAALRDAGVTVDDIAEVRLVGATLGEVKAARGSANYLVEWDLPDDLAMDTYLARKAAKSPLYANVPEVRFLRTYVREDMDKCLCFYDAPDEAAVCRAREAVGAPIDRLTRLGGAGDDGQ